MHIPGMLSSRYLRPGLIGILLAGCACVACLRHGQAGAGAGSGVSAQTPAIPPLSADDVSMLFPAPTQAGDFAKLIAVGDLGTPNAQDPTKRDPVWPPEVFQQFVAIAASPAAQVAGTQNRIGLPPEAQSIGAWFIAGIRIDAGAPGLSNDVRAQFGQRPEIRLIIQPVTRKPDGTPQVLDFAGHLIFDFIIEKPAPAPAGCPPPGLAQPDPDAFNSIVADIAALRTELANGQLGTNKVTTAGLPLGIHPGLSDATTAINLRQEIKSFLERHISGQRLNAMALMGLSAGKPAPWIFLAMVNIHPGVIPALPNGKVMPLNGPTLDGVQFAQMLQPDTTFPRVVPQPSTNNLNPITCQSAALSPTSLPIASRNGVSTSVLMAAQPPPALPPDKIQGILDVINDPAKSHFFNTDCVSCHTETTAAMDLLHATTIPGVDTAVLPNGLWNVRNFGWKGSHATVTRRTAAETAAVVAFINSTLLARQAAPNQ
jgi:hypothetical protein